MIHPFRAQRALGRWQRRSHVRAALLGSPLTVPFADGKLLLGTWRQIILLDFDNRPRQRTLVAQVMGKKGNRRAISQL